METGFPSPAQGYEEQPIDIVRYLMPHPESTFFMRIQSEKLMAAGLNKGDILVIDRSVIPYEGAFIVAETESGFICGKFSLSPRPALCRLNKTLYFTEKTAIFGVVTHSIRKS